ncbi:hypothetical protein [Chengkuizengella axinellae]|uniref:Uncharacterized protein n=1 Tax=Chengkuizengella axinellae TaxID=3064388 RepID=A0ABT9J5T7_9BACL|nr:hypothetical protein [Chengkuizengella sp. 2205SS18-9]MDP5276986.1 hypothetical protein [Chengkuizengella sp. 2205SS18-9]
MFRKTQKSNPQQFEDLDQHLNSIPILKPSSNFVDNIMKQTNLIESKKKLNIQKQMKQKNEAIHFIIASAATYFFISEGIFSIYYQMNPEQFSMEVTETVNGAILYGSELMNMISAKFSQVFHQ